MGIMGIFLIYGVMPDFYHQPYYYRSPKNFPHCALGFLILFMP